MNIKQIAGDNIRFIREKKGWAQEDLSIVSKISKTYIGEIERGQKAVTIVVLQKIAKALKVQPALLLTPNAYKNF
jgi:transcriptional regulator with XRE-family HTH domain